jgi:hypothetical protein
MKNPLGDIVATVHFYSTDAGGRHGPTPEDKFNCLMVVDGKNLDVRLHLECIGHIIPGATIKVPLSFLDWENAKKYCFVGKKFLLKEIRVIGDGVIEEIR